MHCWLPPTIVFNSSHRLTILSNITTFEAESQLDNRKKKFVPQASGVYQSKKDQILDFMITFTVCFSTTHSGYI